MIWIVCPLLRDVESFVRVVEEVRAAIADAGDPRPVRFLVIDDSAGTDPDITRLHPLDDVEVLTPERNLGHQTAIVHGLRHLAPRLADDDVVVTMDSDGEDRPNDVPRLLAALRTPDIELVLARRTTRTETPAFKASYTIFRAAFRALAGTTIRSGNFAAQTAASLTAVIDDKRFDLVYSSTLVAIPRPTVNVPSPRGHRYAGQSRMHTRALVRHGVRMTLPFRRQIRRRLTIAATCLLIAGLTAVAAVAGVPARWIIAAVVGLAGAVHCHATVTVGAASGTAN